MSTLRTPQALAEAGLIDPRAAGPLEGVTARYALALTPALQALIDPRDAADPIARQFVPDLAELRSTPEERADPIGDGAHSPVPGIVHRYPDRVLLKLLHVCPVYCRFCFRRAVVGPGEDAMLPPAEVERALRYIADTPAVWEVILTGGDPFMLAPRRLRAVMERLAAIDHVRVVRLHTRVPVADPARVTPDLVEALRAASKPVYVAVHCNHPRELSAQARGACALLADAGFSLLGQTVLLRGVNDDAATLTDLMRALVEARVRPYYLHHPDLAPGTAHFRVSLEAGRVLVAALRGAVSGLCQPTYVVDLPGGFGKVPVAPDAMVAVEGGTALRDRTGRLHRYPPAGCEGPIER